MKMTTSFFLNGNGMFYKTFDSKLIFYNFVSLITSKFEAVTTQYFTNFNASCFENDITLLFS